ncbi:MAG: 6-pyruvoyl-tetrahydropterin synthase-related protein, partial [Anaerolineaceae bacterium]|nr:6-pyruvoyl-tetrahydropterin synthase-related protein [Anaerolineaceae bacterium]
IFLACSSGMYLFARRRYGELGAVLAGLLYVYSPWLLYSEPFARGAYPGLLALAIFPFLLWRLDVLRERPTPASLVAAVLVQVALINSHNLMAPILTLVALAQVVIETVLQRMIGGKVNWRPAALAVGAVLLGVGAAAAFWLPVVLEGDSVQLENLTAVPMLDFRNHFVPLNELLAGPPLHDGGNANGLHNLMIFGVAQWVLALSGLVTAALFFLRRGGPLPQRPQALAGALFFGLLACLMLALMVPNARGLWERLTFLHVFQFPWRLLGPATAFLAIVGGANGLWLDRLRRRTRGGALALLVVFPLVAALPLLHMPANWRLKDVDTSLAAWYADTGNLSLLGTTATHEFLPRDVHVFPGATGALMADYADGYPVDKFNRGSLPPDSTVRLVHNSPQALEWQIDAGNDFTAEILNFYWVGWRAEIDGQEVEIGPSRDHGLVSFALPAGNHRVRVFLGSTPARDLATGISVMSLLLVAAGAVALRLRPVACPARKWRASTGDLAGILAGGALATLAVLLFFREGSAWIHSPPGEALPAQEQRRYTLDGRIQLLGYDLNPDVLQAGEGLELRLYWYALEGGDVDLSSFVHLTNDGWTHAQVDKRRPGNLASSKWGPAAYVLDIYTLHLPAQLPVGDFQLVTGLYTCDPMPSGECGAGDRLAVTDESGAIIGDHVPLATIRIES